MVCIAEINKFKFAEGDDTISTIEGPTVHKSTRNGQPFGYMDFENPTKETASAYYQGMVDVMRLHKNFQKSEADNLQTDQGNSQFLDNSQNMNNANQQTANKTLTLTTGHSILGNDMQYPNNMSGFTDRILISLLVSFGLGAITTAIYIFISLGKVTINLF